MVDDRDRLKVVVEPWLDIDLAQVAGAETTSRDRAADEESVKLDRTELEDGFRV